MIRILSMLLFAAMLVGCEHRAPMPRPVGAGPVSPEGSAKFEWVASYRKGDTNFEQVKNQIREGDVIAFWMTRKEARTGLFNVRMGALAYLTLDYGHSAIVVRLPGRKPPLRLFSCLPQIGSHFSAGLDELKEKKFMVFRLDRWDEMDAERLREFARIARKKSDQGFAYDYLAACGIWNNDLKPREQHEIQGSYTCSTSVAAALHYAGFDMANVKKRSMFQLVSPKKVFTSKGRIMRSTRASDAGK
ncbi:MAG: hypothetical protein H7A51_14035 [Akkermansiaceae bacterium]|nr:hypothetical protein [Akkermansiaceae bacterium]